MKAIILLSGGQGKQLMSANIVRELAASKRYDSIYIVGAYRWWGSMLAFEYPDVCHEVNPQLLPTLAATIMREPTEWDWLRDDVYGQSDFILRRKHFNNVLREMWKLPTKDDGKLTPPIVMIERAFESEVDRVARSLGKFIILCRRGGGAVLTDQQGRRRIPTEESGLLREYPTRQSTILVEKLRKRGYNVLQCKLKEEELIQGCEQLQNEMPMPFWSMLASRAVAVVTIDSCLMHVAGATAAKMVVLWRETTPEQFGYNTDNIINLLPHNYVPIAPLFSGIPDTPICEPACPDEVITELFGNDKKITK